jgi:hypothetical protein
MIFNSLDYILVLNVLLLIFQTEAGFGEGNSLTPPTGIRTAGKGPARPIKTLLF